MNKQNPREFKIIFLGDSGVGKTSIINQFINKEFDESTQATIGVEYQQKLITIRGETIKLSIFDTSGQEKYRAITQNYYRNADGAVFVYDITKIQSFKNIEDYWIHQLHDNTGKYLNIILFGNKLDLKNECNPDNLVTTEMGIKLARELSTLFIESSAKSSQDIQNVFNELIDRIYSDSVDCQQTDHIELKSTNSDNDDIGNGGFCC